MLPECINSVDPDQTAPGSSLIRVYTVCSGSFVSISKAVAVSGELIKPVCQCQF